MHTSLAFDAPIRGGVPAEYRHDFWCGKNRLVWLPDGEKIEDMFYKFTNVTDRQTDGRTDRHHMTPA